MLQSKKFKYSFVGVLCLVIAGTLWYTKEGESSSPAEIKRQRRAAQMEREREAGRQEERAAAAAGVPAAAPGAPAAAPGAVPAGHTNAEVNAVLREIAARLGANNPAVLINVGAVVGGHAAPQTLEEARDTILNNLVGAGIDFNALLDDIPLGGAAAMEIHPADGTISGILTSFRQAISNMALFLGPQGYGLNIDQIKNSFNGTHRGADLADAAFNPNRQAGFNSPHAIGNLFR